MTPIRNAWAQQPDSVSYGSQKNFERFMAEFSVGQDSDRPDLLLDVPQYKHLIAKAILFKKVQALVRPLVPAFQANVAAYVISLIANRLGSRMDLDKIWLRQDISPELKVRIQVWATEVSKVLHSTANGRMISEWAKKPECWNSIKGASYSEASPNIPEAR